MKKLICVLIVSIIFVSSYLLVRDKEEVVSFQDNIILSSNDISDNWSSSKTFTVKNSTSSDYKINIVLKDLVNTFVTDSLVYKITSSNGYNMSEFKVVPKSSSALDEVLAYNIRVSANSEQSYTITFKYDTDFGYDLSNDDGKKFSGIIQISDGTEPPTMYEQLLADKTERSMTTRPDNDSGNASYGFTGVYTSDNTKTLYTSTENGTTVYYFAGNALDNWVKFGGYYWRIIRTNADGGIRLLYHSTSTTAEDAYIGTSKFNSKNNDSMYAGYMYGTSNETSIDRSNTNNSTIKAYIDNWYKDNLLNYTKYLSTTAIYCNDREVGSGTYSATGSLFYYKAHTRLATNNTPTYDCTNTADAFSVSNTSAKLTYPIALMTADEISFAGGLFSTDASAYYYRNSLSTSTSSTSDIWWYTMSPYENFNSAPYVFYVSGSYRIGHLSATDTIYTEGVRPVISLKSCVKWSAGDGTSENPYEIRETTSGC